MADQVGAKAVMPKPMSNETISIAQAMRSVVVGGFGGGLTSITNLYAAGD
jgi:hypothetical protein